jgi:hypothetical protein
MARFLKIAAVSLLISWCCCAAAWARPTQEEVFRSFKENMSSKPASGSLLPFICAGAALVILLTLIGNRRRERATPRAMNHSGKLLKEVAKAAGIRPSEIKKLKNLAQQAGERQGTPMQSPLTLLLCPSVLAMTMRQAKEKR